MEQIRNFDQLLQAALAHGRKGIAVAAPYDKNTLLAVKDALASGLAAPQLFGDVERMLPLLEQVQLDAGAVELTDVRDTAQAIDAAIESIRSGENQILMKGTVSTGTLLKHALDRTRALGIETPKAACLAAVETVNPKMQATVDAACLCKMADRGAFPGAVVEGPWPWTTSSPPRLPGKRASTPRCPAMPTSSWPRPSRWPTPSPRS